MKKVQRRAQSAVQRSGALPVAQRSETVHAAAERGTSGAGGELPFLDAIQASFGEYDVGGIQAHVGGEAAVASGEMGAEAYATGDDVAFGASPDLHLAAHEAAHVVQQRNGVSLSSGVGSSGDAYEKHADEAADAVVAGKTAEPILARMAGSGGGEKGVQRSASRSSDVSAPVVTLDEVVGPLVDPCAAYCERQLETMAVGAPATDLEATAPALTPLTAPAAAAYTVSSSLSSSSPTSTAPVQMSAGSAAAVTSNAKATGSMSSDALCDVLFADVWARVFADILSGLDPTSPTKTVSPQRAKQPSPPNTMSPDGPGLMTQSYGPDAPDYSLVVRALAGRCLAGILQKLSDGLSRRE